MLTAKEVREVIFPRSMGNYRKDEVDDFLDRCADTIEELSKQNDDNSRKMQVLAQTVMEYRNQEDSIRSALINAQRMSETVIADARKQADDILDAARAEAENMREAALAATVAEQDELKRVKQEVADFKAKLMSIYREHLTLIGVLEGESEAEEETQVQEVEEISEPAAEVVVPAIHNMPDFTELEIVDEE